MSRVLESIEALDYPKERILLLMVDNYSKDGAYEMVREWLQRVSQRYLGAIHIRARGNPARLRNIALISAMEHGVELFSFIDSDIIVDSDFLKRTLKVMMSYEGDRKVFSVSAVWDVGFENLDWLEKRRKRWLRSRASQIERGIFVGEACNTSACLIRLGVVQEVGLFDEDISFIEDLDWGRRATRKGFLCLFDATEILPHLRKYSLREFRKYFMRGALSEAKLILKNGLAIKALRSALYWDAVAASVVFSFVNPIPLLVLIGLGFTTYFMRCRGLGRLLLYPITLPFSVARSAALTLAMLYWLIRGGYRVEKVTVGRRDWEVEILKAPPQFRTSS